MIPALLLYASLVNDVRTLVAHRDFAAAERALRGCRTPGGATPECAAALSWMARGELDARRLDRADAYAEEARKTALAQLGARRLDADPWLPMALGAAIEVHAQVLAARGERAEAVAFLKQQAAEFGATSLGERIRKNLNVLNLEGKPAPPLDEAVWLGPKPQPLSALRGHAVLLFFWAHWCPDCKAEAPILASLMKTYGPKGLVLIGPTKLYGFAAQGEEAPPAAEERYTLQVRQRFYPGLAEMPVPLSAANFLAYGASTTPTLALIDRKGVVRFYHPGAVPEAELAARIQRVLGE